MLEVTELCQQQPVGDCYVDYDTLGLAQGPGDNAGGQDGLKAQGIVNKELRSQTAVEVVCGVV